MDVSHTHPVLKQTFLEFVPKVQISNIPTLAQITAWRGPGDKPLSEPMIVRFLTSEPIMVRFLTDLAYSG